MADDRGAPRYSREEVEEILRRAAERTHEDGDHLAHEDLVAAAREAGIDVGALESVAIERMYEREDQRAVAVWDARRKRRFASHAVTYAIIQGGLFLMNLLTGGVWWFLWPLLAWGMLLALHGASALRRPTPDQVERVTRRERRRREAERKREQRRAQREHARERELAARQGRGAPGRAFEQAVESGVNALMDALAKRLEGSRPPLPDTEFNRYVTRQKQGVRAPAPAQPAPRAQPARPAVITPPPRVRVEDPAREEDALEDARRAERIRR